MESRPLHGPAREDRARPDIASKWTVIGGLLAFIVMMFLAFGPLKGTLENKFVIPGSDAQKATDLLKAKFGARTAPASRSSSTPRTAS